MYTNAQSYVSTTPGLRNVVIESWNGMQCGWCTQSDGIIQDIINTNPAGRVVAMNVHSGFFAIPQAGQPDFTTPEGEIHHNGFGVQAYPQSTINRRDNNGSQFVGYFTDTTLIPAVLNDTSEVNMYLDAFIDTSNRELDVKIEYYYTSDAPSQVNYLYVAILQNNMLGPQSDFTSNTGNPGAYISYPNIYSHMRVFRMYLSAQWGDPIITTTSGSTNLLNYNVVLPDSINGQYLDPNEVEVIAFINDGLQSNGDVLNGASVDPLISSLDVTALSYTEEVMVYPNPSNGLFNVKSSIGSEFTVTDILGRKVMSIQNENTVEVVDLSSNPDGIYHLKVLRDGKLMSSKKLVKR
jgi:hypothetical protein